jgi:hypothetical protein
MNDASEVQVLRTTHSDKQEILVDDTIRNEAQIDEQGAENDNIDVQATEDNPTALQ